MNYDQKLQIARMAYREIIEVVEKFETPHHLGVHCHWDECITIDDILFHSHQLRVREEGED